MSCEEKIHNLPLRKRGIKGDFKSLSFSLYERERFGAIMIKRRSW